MIVTEYAIETGRPITIHRGRFKITDFAPNDLSGFIEGEYSPADFYIKAGAAVPRPAITASLDLSQIPADGVTPISLSGLPIDATEPVSITYSGPGFEETGTMDPGDPDCEFTADHPGSYRVKVRAFPYLDLEVDFEAV